MVESGQQEHWKSAKMKEMGIWPLSLSENWPKVIRAYETIND